MNKEIKMPDGVLPIAGFNPATEEQIAIINEAIQYAVQYGDVIYDPEHNTTPYLCFSWPGDSHDHVVGFSVSSMLGHETDKLLMMYLHDYKGEELCRCGILLATDAKAEGSTAPLTNITFPGAEFVLKRCIHHELIEGGRASHVQLSYKARQEMPTCDWVGIINAALDKAVENPDILEVPDKDFEESLNTPFITDYLVWTNESHDEAVLLAVRDVTACGADMLHSPRMLVVALYHDGAVDMRRTVLDTNEADDMCPDVFPNARKVLRIVAQKKEEANKREITYCTKSDVLDTLQKGGKRSLCVLPIRSMHSWLHAIKNPPQYSNVMLEVRLDCIPEIRIAPADYDTLSKCPLPTMLTYRTKAEGGCDYCDRAPKFWLEDLKRLMHGTSVAAIDIEIAHLQEAQETMQLVQLAHGCNIAVIGSYHNYECTPSVEEMVALDKKARDLGADCTKFAFGLNNVSDIQKGVDLLHEVRKPMAVMGMGPLGPASRIIYTQYGSNLLYCAACGKEQQLSLAAVAELQSTMDIKYL